MDVAEAIEKRTELEKNILNLVQRYEEETGLMVDLIDIERMTARTYQKQKTRVVYVKATVMMIPD